jgi:hypothetical protein
MGISISDTQSRARRFIPPPVNRDFSAHFSSLDTFRLKKNPTQHIGRHLVQTPFTLRQN